MRIRRNYHCHVLYQGPALVGPQKAKRALGFKECVRTVCFERYGSTRTKTGAPSFAFFAKVGCAQSA